jgi:hypothetical protein
MFSERRLENTVSNVRDGGCQAFALNFMRNSSIQIQMRARVR